MQSQSPIIVIAVHMCQPLSFCGHIKPYILTWKPKARGSLEAPCDLHTLQSRIISHKPLCKCIDSIPTERVLEALRHLKHDGSLDPKVVDKILDDNARALYGL